MRRQLIGLAAATVLAIAAIPAHVHGGRDLWAPGEYLRTGHDALVPVDRDGRDRDWHDRGFRRDWDRDFRRDWDWDWDWDWDKRWDRRWGHDWDGRRVIILPDGRRFDRFGDRRHDFGRRIIIDEAPFGHFRDFRHDFRRDRGPRLHHRR